MTFEELKLAPQLLQALDRVRLHRTDADPGAGDSRRCSRAATSSARRRPAPARPPRSCCRRCSGSPRHRGTPARPGATASAIAARAGPRADARARAAGRRAGGALRPGLRVNTVCIYGGAPYPVQNRELARGVDILVATPGRLIDHLERGRIDLSRLEMLVLDEADRMLDMGFIDDVERIALLTPKTRQTVLFSATFDGAIARLAGAPDARSGAHRRAGARRRRRSRSSSACISPTTIRTSIGCSIICSPIRRSRQSIVFIATKRDAESLALRLRARATRPRRCTAT